MILVVFVMFIGYAIAYWHDKRDKFADYSEVKNNWELSYDDVVATVDFPCSVKIGNAKEFTVSHVITKDDLGIEIFTTRDMYLITYYCNAYIYVDDMEVARYECETTKNSRTEGMTYFFYILPENLIGKTLSIRYVPQINIGTFRIAPVLLGSKGDIIRHLYNEGLVGYSLIFIIMVLGAGVIVINIIRIIAKQNTDDNELLYLGLFAIMCGLYLGSRLEWIRVSISRPIVIYVVEFVSQLCMMTPLTIFLEKAAKKKGRILLRICFGMNFVMAITQIVLYLATPLELREMLLYSHIVLFISTFLFMIVIFVMRDLEDGYRREITYSIIPLAVFGVMDVIIYYVSPALQSGVMLKVGLVVFLTMELVFNTKHYRKSLIVEQKAAIYQELAYKDLATGLRNRNAFEQDCEAFNNDSERLVHVCVVFFDLNHLKYTNDTFGHAAGDKLINSMGELLRKSFEGNEVYRMGGDEFIVMVDSSNIDVEEILSKMESEKPENLEYAYGVVHYDREHHNSVADVVREADARMYEQKRKRREARK